MRKDIRRRRDAQVRTSVVCSQHTEIFDATPGGQSTRAALNTYVADTDRLLILQQESLQERRAATEQVRLGRRALPSAIKAVVMFGRLVNLPDTVMGAMQLAGPMSDDELSAYAGTLLKR